jgi:hypothetical protein
VGGSMFKNVRTVNVELTSDDARYILYALNEFKKQCKEKVDADENGDDDLTHMYANDILETKMVYEKINKISEPEFGKEALQVSYELL